MDEDRLGSMGRRVAGSIKEAIGKIMGDAGTQAEGALQKGVGTIRTGVGGAKDSARQAVGE